MHLSMFPSPSLGVEGDGDTQGLDQQKSLPPEFDRTLRHRDETLDTIDWNSGRNYV